MSLAFNLNLLLHTGFPVFFWIRPKWSIEQMGDQTGKVRALMETVLMKGGRRDRREFGNWLCDV